LSEKFSTETGHTNDDTRADAVGPMRLLPSVTFGLRVAALSAAALPVSLLAANLIAGAPASLGPDSTLGTTCCPPGPA